MARDAYILQKTNLEPSRSRECSKLSDRYRPEKCLWWVCWSLMCWLEIKFLRKILIPLAFRCDKELRYRLHTHSYVSLTRRLIIRGYLHKKISLRTCIFFYIFFEFPLNNNGFRLFPTDRDKVWQINGHFNRFVIFFFCDRYKL